MMHMKAVRRINLFVCLALSVALGLAQKASASSDLPGLADVTLSVDASADQHAISPYIYGIHGEGLSATTSPALLQTLHLPLQRWGGNTTTRYNWKNDIANHGSDFYFENIPEDNPAPQDGNAADYFVQQGANVGADTIVTIPLIGKTSRDGLRPNGGHYCGFSTTKYNYTPAPLYDGDSAHDTYDPSSSDCGTGKRTNGTFVTGNDPADTSITVDANYMRDWVQHLVDTHGTAANGGVRFYGLDNEPGLWHETHRDVHPQHATYEELRDLGYQYAAAIKAADPTAQTLGPVQDGWSRYFYASYTDDPDVFAQQDRDNHNGQPFVEWYLDQMQAYEQQHGTRILDYFDLHYYPQADGVSLSPAGDADTQAKRLRSTRSLWDPTYADESWIGDTEEGPDVRLIPRMHEWVNAHYPGTKLSISEYNWGGLESINGALTQADVLGIFGREGLDMAVLFDPPQPDQPGAFAFRIYRNYDGNGGAFGDTSVHAASSDQDQVAIYAARRSSDGALTLMLINKTKSNQTPPVSLAGFTPSGSAAVYRYSAANLGTIAHLPDQSIQSNNFSPTLPAESITLMVLSGTSNPTPSPTPEAPQNEVLLPVVRKR